MRHQGKDAEVTESEAARAASLPADQPDFAVSSESIDLADTTSIRHGAQATTGKAVWSASRMSANEKLFETYDVARREQEERDGQILEELANLAAWNLQMTVVGMRPAKSS